MMKSSKITIIKFIRLSTSIDPFEWSNNVQRQMITQIACSCVYLESRILVAYQGGFMRRTADNSERCSHGIHLFIARSLSRNDNYDDEIDFKRAELSQEIYNSSPAMLLVSQVILRL